MRTLRVTAALRVWHNGSGPCPDEGLRVSVTSSLARVRPGAAYTAPAFSRWAPAPDPMTNIGLTIADRALLGRGLERRNDPMGTATGTAVSARSHRPGPAPYGAAARSELPLDEPPHSARMGLLPRARGADAPQA